MCLITTLCILLWPVGQAALLMRPGLHVREAYSVHLVSLLPIVTQEMHRLSTADNFIPTELTQAALTLVEDPLLYSAREVLGLKTCIQGRRHAWWTLDLRLPRCQEARHVH